MTTPPRRRWSRYERRHFIWSIVTVGNALAFLVHALIDGTSAFGSGSTFVDGHYVVLNHGNEIVFTTAAYYFNYAHGVLFVVVQIPCCVALWRLYVERKQRRQSD